MDEELKPVEEEVVETEPEDVTPPDGQEPVNNEPESVTDFEAASEPEEGDVNEEEPEVEPAEPTELEQLQIQFEALQAQLTELQSNYTAAQESLATLTSELETLRSENATMQASIQNYEAREAENENARKNSLIEKYQKLISEEEITEIVEHSADFSYDELEGKLAITFANKQMETVEDKIPLPEPPETQFALLMKKYRKN